MVFLFSVLYAFTVMLVINQLFWVIETIYKTLRLRITIQSIRRFTLVALPSVLLSTAIVAFCVWDHTNTDSVFAQYRNLPFWESPVFYGLLVGFLAGSQAAKLLERKVRGFVGITVN